MQKKRHELLLIVSIHEKMYNLKTGKGGINERKDICGPKSLSWSGVH